MRDDPKYQSKFVNLYPTAGVDFFKTEDRPVGHENTMPPLTNVVISVPEEHVDAEAAECTWCDALEVENKQLRLEN